MSLRFEWDERKNASNLKKHRVSFEEARTAFFDDDALLRDDPDHSDLEDRFVLLGMSRPSGSSSSATASEQPER